MDNPVIKGIIFFIILIILIWFVAFTTKYFLTPCHRRKDFLSYLFGFCWNKVCKEETVGENRVFYMGSAPQKESIPEEIINELEDVVERDQVFHISNQDYSYEQAKCKCNGYGARLATYEEMVEAFNKGADWCSYGWTEGQTAYYPTQQCSWDKLQKGPKENRKDCGKPGLNGGFFPNPYLKFGVNCYGKKPEGKVVKMNKPYCPFKDFCKISQNYASSHKLPTDNIAPFNSDRWSE